MRNVKNLITVAVLTMVALLAFPSISGSGLFDRGNDTATLDAYVPADIVSMDRISGVKTFFTKLHPGAIEFLDEQIANWLKDNPDVVVQQTNATVGEIESDKKEMSIIINVWY